MDAGGGRLSFLWGCDRWQVSPHSAVDSTYMGIWSIPGLSGLCRKRGREVRREKLNDEVGREMKMKSGERCVGGAGRSWM